MSEKEDKVYLKHTEEALLKIERDKKDPDFKDLNTT